MIYMYECAWTIDVCKANFNSRPYHIYHHSAKLWFYTGFIYVEVCYFLLYTRAIILYSVRLYYCSYFEKKLILISKLSEPYRLTRSLALCYTLQFWLFEMWVRLNCILLLLLLYAWNDIVLCGKSYFAITMGRNKSTHYTVQCIFGY